MPRVVFTQQETFQITDVEHAELRIASSQIHKNPQSTMQILRSLRRISIVKSLSCFTVGFITKFLNEGVFNVRDIVDIFNAMTESKAISVLSSVRKEIAYVLWLLLPIKACRRAFLNITPETQLHIVETVPSGIVADTLNPLNPILVSRVLLSAQRTVAKEILSEMSPDAASRVLVVSLNSGTKLWRTLTQRDLVAIFSKCDSRLLESFLVNKQNAYTNPITYRKSKLTPQCASIIDLLPLDFAVSVLMQNAFYDYAFLEELIEELPFAKSAAFFFKLPLQLAVTLFRRFLVPHNSQLKPLAEWNDDDSVNEQSIDDFQLALQSASNIYRMKLIKFWTELESGAVISWSGTEAMHGFTSAHNPSIKNNRQRAGYFAKITELAESEDSQQSLYSSPKDHHDINANKQTSPQQRPRSHPVASSAPSTKIRQIFSLNDLKRTVPAEKSSNLENVPVEKSPAIITVNSDITGQHSNLNLESAYGSDESSSIFSRSSEVTESHIYIRSDSSDGISSGNSDKETADGGTAVSAERLRELELENEYMDPMDIDSDIDNVNTRNTQEDRLHMGNNNNNNNNNDDNDNNNNIQNGRDDSEDAHFEKKVLKNDVNDCEVEENPKSQPARSPNIASTTVHSGQPQDGEKDNGAINAENTSVQAQDKELSSSALSERPAPTELRNLKEGNTAQSSNPESINGSETNTTTTTGKDGGTSNEGGKHPDNVLNEQAETETETGPGREIATPDSSSNQTNEVTAKAQKRALNLSQSSQDEISGQYLSPKMKKTAHFSQNVIDETIQESPKSRKDNLNTIEETIPASIDELMVTGKGNSSEVLINRKESSKYSNRKFHMPRVPKKSEYSKDAKLLPTYPWFNGKASFQNIGDYVAPVKFLASFERTNKERNSSLAPKISNLPIIAFDTSYMELVHVAPSKKASVKLNSVIRKRDLPNGKVVEYSHKNFGPVLFYLDYTMNQSSKTIVTQYSTLSAEMKSKFPPNRPASLGSLDLYGYRALSVISKSFIPTDKRLAALWPQIGNAHQMLIPLGSVWVFEGEVAHNKRKSAICEMKKITDAFARVYNEPIVGNRVTILFLTSGIIRIILPREQIRNLWDVFMMLNVETGTLNDHNLLLYHLKKPSFPVDFPHSSAGKAIWSRIMEESHKLPLTNGEYSVNPSILADSDQNQAIQHCLVEVHNGQPNRLAEIFAFPKNSDPNINESELNIKDIHLGSRNFIGIVTTGHTRHSSYSNFGIGILVRAPKFSTPYKCIVRNWGSYTGKLATLTLLQNPSP